MFEKGFETHLNPKENLFSAGLRPRQSSNLNHNPDPEQSPKKRVCAVALKQQVSPHRQVKGVFVPDLSHRSSC